MIGMLRGKVWEIQAERLVVDVNGIGYILTVPYSLLAKSFPGQELIVYTHVIMRDNDLSLYGFSSLEEKQLFLKMLSVSGIGPKAAISLLSTFSVVQVENAIVNKDLNLLTKVPGIGKKTAQRLILELKEKIKAPGSPPTGEESFSIPSAPIHSEAVQTLLALGFSVDEAKRALEQVLKDCKELTKELTTEEKVKKALRLLAPGQKVEVRS
jgi:Holliday junction DNA helicase RuvA